MARRSGAALVLLAGLVMACGCGMKGDPLAPIRRSPVRVSELSVRRMADRIELAFTVPPVSTEGATPRIDRVEVYGLTAAADAPEPPSLQMIVDPRNLVGRVMVGSGAETTPGPDPAVRRVQPGERASVVDRLDAASGANGVTRYFTAVVVTGSGRGRQEPGLDVIPVTIDSLPSAPATVTATHDEKAIRVTWPAGPDGELFEVGRGSGSETQSAGIVTAAPITANEFAMPIAGFGQEICFRVRGVRVKGAVTVEGPLSAPHCITPVDTYPPPAPGGLRALQDNNFVTLTWTAVEASDLAGYIVLRGEGPGENMQPLMRDAVGETTFRDTTVQPGVTYSYAVYAVDKAAKPNISQLSNRETVTVR